MAAMAIADGYQSEWSSAQIEAHLAVCADCRQEVGEMRGLTSLLDAQVRRTETEDVWRVVEGQLSNTRTSPRAHDLRPLLLCGVLLIGYRIVEMVPDRDFGFLFKLLPVLLVIAAFSYLRENPFKINTELRLEGE